MKYIEEGTEFLDQLKDNVHDLYDENKELKKEIERLNKIIKQLDIKNLWYKNTIDKAKEKTIEIQNKYGYILDDLTYLLMQCGDSDV